MRRGPGYPPCVLTALSFGERFTLWSVRCWTEAKRYGGCLHPLLSGHLSTAKHAPRTVFPLQAVAIDPAECNLH